MTNFKNWGRGVALASSTLALGSALAISSSISSAQAVSLGSINITGGSTISNVTDPSPANDTISFTAPFTTVSSEGAFAGLVANSISTINLTSSGAGTEVSGTTLTPYSSTIPTSFISFTNGSTFVLDEAPIAGRSFTPSLGENIVGYTFPELRGTLLSSTNDFISQGILTANQISGTAVNGSFSFTLSALNVGVGQPVPEPTTTGALAALGIGALFTNNVVKKKKVKINA
ncbi:PEP-CTERM sorting domain-containing protein [Nostoc sp. MS1]|uniref:PEP-CTERM sorting domain-containing protein n=1 Tax=Nostoc sp. MS1 TaxID=2764711 RepID=UPI001CC6DFC6|nr:PEP-CTERM sorting domain-containing protein [Nostoc sp. MS1]